MLPDVIYESPNRRLYERQTAEISVQLDVGAKFVDAAKRTTIHGRQHDLQLRPLVEHHARFEIAHRQGDGLAEISVRGIAEHSRARVGVRANEFDHESSFLTRSRRRGPYSGSASANSTKVSK